MFRCCLTSSLLAVAFLGGVAAAGPSVLVDHLHGYVDADRLQAVWPDADFTVLGPADHPVQTVLAAGVAYQEEDLVFTVPPGQEALYGYFLCDDTMVQHPFITVRDPAGVMRAGGFFGGFHVEDPVPGAWTVHFDDWEPQLRPYTIGAGPHALTADVLAPYDAVLRIWDDTMLMFYGEAPHHSAREAAAVQAYVEAGGASLYLREPLVEMALKPVIDLTGDADLRCDVRVGLPGRLSYAEPPAEQTGEVAVWRDVDVAAGEVTRLLYEVAMSPPHHHLEVATAGAPAAANLTGHPLRDVLLVRHLGGDRWLLVGGGDLAPHAARTLAAAREMSLDALRATLTAIMSAGGRAAGLSGGQMTAFLERYHWVDRLVLDATGRAGWTALYRAVTSLCDQLLPLATDPPAAGRARTLWFWVTGIPDGLTAGQGLPPLAPSPGVDGPGAAAAALRVTEYGVIRQRYPVATALKDRDQTWLGWTFHDDFQLVDWDDYLGTPYQPLLHEVGEHPWAPALMAGLDAIGGVTCGGVVAPGAHQLVTGDADTFTDDEFFYPGSWPPFAVARDLGQGHAAAAASRHMLHLGPDANVVFLRRLLDLLTDELTAAHPPAPTAPVSVDVHPNPFNPGTTIAVTVAEAGPLTVTLHDLRGRLVARLLDEDVQAGERRLAWDGLDGRRRPVAAGVYLLRVRTGGAAAVRKLTLAP